MVRSGPEEKSEYRWPLLWSVSRRVVTERHARYDPSPAPDPGHFTTEPLAEVDGSLMQRQLAGGGPEVERVAVAVTAMAIVATGRHVDREAATCFASAGNGETPRPSYTTTRQEFHPCESPARTNASREGRHPPAPSDRPRARLRPLRRVPALAHPVLPLAEAVLRERRRRLRAQERDARAPNTSATIAALRDKLQRKNEVVAELMEEHIQLKKELGEL